MNLLPGQDYIITENLTLKVEDSKDQGAIGGFHTLCADVGNIPGHPLSGFYAGDPIPYSLWNQHHRAGCKSNAGMVYDDVRDLWVDIYLFSSANRNIIHETLENYKDIGMRCGKRLPTHEEFSSLAEGSNELTNIRGSKYTPISGGNIDTQGRRMISNIGCEDCAGLIWQYLLSLDPADPEYTLFAGGYWNDAANAGSRCRNANNYRWTAYTSLGARFVAEPLFPRERRIQENKEL